MAEYDAVSASEKDADSPINVSLINKLDQNPHAIAEGASGAPRIQTDALEDDAVTQAKMANNSVGQSQLTSNSVHQSELDTSSGTVSSTASHPNYSHLVLPGGSHGFYPQTRIEGSFTDLYATLAEGSSYTSFTTIIALGSDTGNEVTARQRYVNSSPPIDLGDGDIPLFFFAEIDSNSNVIKTYVADVPPWLYNGPTSTKPDLVMKNRAGQLEKFQYRKTIDRERGVVTKELVVMGNDIKNADMDLIPHPFPGATSSNSIVLLDPPDTLDLLEMHNAEESLAGLVRDGYLRIDNEELNRAKPRGVKAVKYRWRQSR